jgi:hypothetical protein
MPVQFDVYECFCSLMYGRKLNNILHFVVPNNVKIARSINTHIYSEVDIFDNFIFPSVPRPEVNTHIVHEIVTVVTQLSEITEFTERDDSEHSLQ